MFDPIAPTVRLELEEGLVSSSSRAALEAALAQMHRANLVVVETPAGDAGVLVAQRVASALLSSEEAREIDIRVGVPEKDKWSMQEVNDLIIAPAAFVPVERTIVVVASAERMDTSAAEHLLKTVEEPNANALFLFVVQDRSLLLPTITGRAASVVRIELADEQERIRGLVSLGLDPATAQEVTALVGPNVALASAFARLAGGQEETLEDLRTAFGFPLRHAQPSQSAFRLAEVLERLSALAVTPGGTSRAARPSKALAKSPQAKAALRNLVRKILDNWRASLSPEVLLADTPEAYGRTVSALSALDDAEGELMAYAPPAHVLAALFSRCS